MDRKIKIDMRLANTDDGYVKVGMRCDFPDGELIDFSVFLPITTEQPTIIEMQAEAYEKAIEILSSLAQGCRNQVKKLPP